MNELIPLESLAPEPGQGWVLNLHTGDALHCLPSGKDSTVVRWYHYRDQKAMTWERALEIYGPLTTIETTEQQL